MTTEKEREIYNLLTRKLIDKYLLTDLGYEDILNFETLEATSVFGLLMCEQSPYLKNVYYRILYEKLISG